LKKILLNKKFKIHKTWYKKSGPCLFGFCAGHNQATAYLTGRLIQILNISEGVFRITDVSIHRDSVSDWNVYNSLVNTIQSQYHVGQELEDYIADAINEKMWKIHTSHDRGEYSKDDLAFLGIYMSDVKSTANTRDTGNWLVFDYINCDAGIFINRLENTQINNSVFNKSYKQMYKQCGWDKIK